MKVCTYLYFIYMCMYVCMYVYMCPLGCIAFEGSLAGIHAA